MFILQIDLNYLRFAIIRIKLISLFYDFRIFNHKKDMLLWKCKNQTNKMTNFIKIMGQFNQYLKLWKVSCPKLKIQITSSISSDDYLVFNGIIDKRYSFMISPESIIF